MSDRDLFDRTNRPSREELAALRAQRRAERDRERRAALDKKITGVSVAVLTAAFVLGIFFFAAFPRSTKSQIEKRELAKFPSFSAESYLSGDFTAGIATWYDDTVPYHDGFKNLGNNIKSVFGLPKSQDSVQFFGQVDKVNTPVKVPPKATPAPVSSPPPVTTVLEQVSVTETGIVGAAGRHTSVEGGGSENPFPGQDAEGHWANGLIVIWQDGHYRALELFGGGGSSYAQALNTLKSKVGDGVTLWSMPAPLACEFYTPSNFQEYTASQKECFDGVAAKLDSGIHSINICEELAAHAGEAIYCRTDHHWQPLGAYYAAKAFAEAAGVPFADLSTYSTGRNEGFVGTMYAFTESADILNDPEDFVYYVPGVEYETHFYDTSFDYNYSGDLFVEVDTDNSYLMFMGGDQQCVKIDTRVKNGRKLLVIKDSYGNAEIPFYTASFQQVYVADMRYFNRNLVSFIRDMGITDVLFTMSAFSVVGDNADNLMNLIEQYEGETVVDGQLPAAGEAEGDTGSSSEPGSSEAPGNTSEGENAGEAGEPESAGETGSGGAEE